MKIRNLKTKIMSILLTIVMLLGMLPMSAFAADAEDYITVFRKSVSAGQYFAGGSGEVVSTAPDSNYLYYQGNGKITLKNLVHSDSEYAILTENKDVSITLIGESEFTHDNGIASVIINSGKLQISGDGSFKSNRGISCSGFELSGGTVTAEDVTSAGNISISGGKLTLTVWGLVATGDSKISISGGKVTAVGNRYGIYATGDNGTVSITGGEVEATVRNTSIGDEKAIYANTVTIGGNMNILAGSSANDAAAVDAYNGEMYVKITPKVQPENKVITLTPDDLVEGASGEGWVFSNNRLTIQPEYTLFFEGECPVYVVNNGNIENGIFNGEVFSEGTISGGTFNERVNNNGTITGGTFNGTVANNTTSAVISNGIFNGEAHNFGTISGGTFSGKLVNYWDQSISGITIELSNALIEGGESYGWSLDDNNLNLNSGITFYWKAGEECAYYAQNSGTISGGTFSSHVTNAGTISGGTFSNEVENHGNGTITGGTFSAGVYNAGTISGGKFTSVLGGVGIVTGTADLSELTGLDIRYGLRFGKDVKLPKAVMKGNLTYTGCDASTRITLEYYADGVYTSAHTVSGSDYSFAVEGYKRTNPDADLSTLEEITNEVKAASMDGYEISVKKANNTVIHVTVTHTAEYIYVSNGDGTHSRTCTDATHTHDDKTENCSGGIATCTEKAVCTVCAVAYGDTLPHTYGTEWKSDGTNHWHECTCGAKSEEAAHSGTATCTEKAVCTVCAVAYGDTLPHTYGTEWKSDGTNHWHECSCGAKSEEATHSGTATCTEKAVCTVCAVAYGDTLPHTYGTEWKSDGTNHWHECSCGAKSGEAAHSGGTATCTEKAVCTVCAVAYGDTVPHTFGTEWKSDGTNHWHECTCGAKSEEATHSGGTATCKDKAVCSVCTATYGELANHTYKDGKCAVCEAADPNYVPETDSPQTGDNSHMALWLALLFISGGAVVTLTVYGRKRRNTN